MQVLRVRRIIQCTAFLVPALALAGLAALPLSATQAMFVFVAALGIQALGQAGFVANMSDIAPRNAGTVFGLCNTVGCLAGIIGVALAGQLYQATGSFNALFFMTCALYAVGAVTFLLFSKADPIFGEV
jgi:ACS family sodium-dependent inorganic phosphate cotransporter/ACS family sodium-dependent inorganic phosphate cotransporter-like MFS transporter 9